MSCKYIFNFSFLLVLIFAVAQLGCNSNEIEQKPFVTTYFQAPSVLQKVNSVHDSLTKKNKQLLRKLSRSTMELAAKAAVDISLPVSLNFSGGGNVEKAHSAVAFDKELFVTVENIPLNYPNKLLINTASLKSAGHLNLKVYVKRNNDILWATSLTIAMPTTKTWNELSIDLPVIKKDCTVTIILEPKKGGFYALGDPAILPKRESISKSELPNVIVISLDTLRADHLGFMGYDRDTSPNIDKLAANSLVFTNAYSQSGFTLSSHKSILSGFSTKLFDYYSNSPISHKKKLTGEVPLLQHYLKEAGYYTVAFTGGAFMGSKFGFSSGFDSFTARKEGFNIKGKGTAKGKISGFDNPLAWLDQNGRTGPYFMLLHTYATHGPYAPPRSYNKYFGKSSSELFNNTISIPKLEKFSLDPSLYLDGDLEQVIRVYDRGIRWVDDSVGKLIQKLEDLGTLDNTVIILLSDHGDEFLEHGRFGHRTMWDAQLHVPLIIHIPKTKGNPRLVETNVELINVTPTILDILGIESPIQMQGESLLKFAVNEPTDDIGRPVFSSQDSSRDQTLDNNKRSKVGFVTCKFKGYKYHFLFNKQENWVGDRLFNISNDPVETDDLVISGMSKKEKVMLEELRTRALVYMANSTPGYNILVSSDIEPVKVRVRASDTRANKKLKALGRSWKLTNQKQSLVLNQISAKGMNRGLVMLAEDYVLEDAKLVITNADNIALGLSSMANTDSPIYLDSVPEYFGTPTNLMELVLEAIRRNSVVIWKTVHSFKNVDVGESVISKETINELKNLGYVQ